LIALGAKRAPRYRETTKANQRPVVNTGRGCPDGVLYKHLLRPPWPNFPFKPMRFGLE